MCSHCAYYLGDLTCLAFPEGIPSEVLLGPSDHSVPLPGQKNKFVFKAGSLADLTPDDLKIRKH